MPMMHHGSKLTNERNLYKNINKTNQSFASEQILCQGQWACQWISKIMRLDLVFQAQSCDCLAISCNTPAG